MKTVQIIFTWGVCLNFVSWLILTENLFSLERGCEYLIQKNQVVTKAKLFQRNLNPCDILNCSQCLNNHFPWRKSSWGALFSSIIIWFHSVLVQVWMQAWAVGSGFHVHLQGKEAVSTVEYKWADKSIFATQIKINIPNRIWRSGLLLNLRTFSVQSSSGVKFSVWRMYLILVQI